MDKVPLIEIPENPIPDGLEMSFIDADDKARLRVGFLPCSDAQGAVLVHPGWAEFIEKYFEVAEDLRQRGFDVMIVDPRGQGFSQRYTPGDSRGLITDFRQFRSDMSVHFSELKRRFNGPYFVLAHSMGGLVTLDWLAHAKPTDLAGAAVCAPLTRLFPSRMKRIAVRNMARWALLFGGAKRHIRVSPEQSMDFETNRLTHDPRRHERFRLLQLAAPAAQAGPPRFGWVNAAMMTMMRLSRPGALASIDMPLALISADADETVDPTHHRELAGHYPTLHLTRVERARHELLMEDNEFRDQAFRAIDLYMEDRLAAVRENIPPVDSSTAPSNTKSSSASAI